MNKTTIQLFSLAFLALQSLTVHADVYEYIDEQGVSHYSNVPTDTRYQLIIEETTVIAQSQPSSGKAEKHSSPQTVETLVSYRSPSPQIIAQIEQSANNNQLDSALIQAVMQVESANKPKARSPKGAQGLMQLMPATARRFGVKDSFDPAQNIEGGAKYLKTLLTMFNHDIPLTLAAYNAGEQAVIKYGNKIPPYQETQAYVPKVLHIYKALLKKREKTEQVGA